MVVRVKNYYITQPKHTKHHGLFKINCTTAHLQSSHKSRPSMNDAVERISLAYNYCWAQSVVLWSVLDRWKQGMSQYICIDWWWRTRGQTGVKPLGYTFEWSENFEDIWMIYIHHVVSMYYSSSHCKQPHVIHKFPNRHLNASSKAVRSPTLTLTLTVQHNQTQAPSRLDIPTTNLRVRETSI